MPTPDTPITRLDAMRALLTAPVPEGEPDIKPPVPKYPGDPDRHRLAKQTVVEAIKIGSKVYGD